MKAKTFLACFVALFAIAAILVLPSVSAFVTIGDVQIDGVAYDGGTATVAAGDVISLRVPFTADETRDRVWVEADLTGEPGFGDMTEEFRVEEGGTYRKYLEFRLPFDLDDDLSQDRNLRISVESSEGDRVIYDIALRVQRESNLIEVLSVAGNTEVAAGETAFWDIVLRNRGTRKLDNTLVDVSIPALGISSRVHYGDLYPIDHQNGTESEEDSAERRLFLRIPSTAKTGVYDVEITAFNSDSTTTVLKRLVIVPGLGTNVVSSSDSKTVAVGEMADYTMTIVNAGNTIQIYELIVDADSGLNVDLDETVIVVPAGSSKTVQFTAEAEEEGNYDFSVNVHSNGEIVQSKTFRATVEGSSIASGNAAVVLTIILAIIFIVLLVVLIVLLTRKPENKEEFGESYY